MIVLFTGGCSAQGGAAHNRNPKSSPSGANGKARYDAGVRRNQATVDATHAAAVGTTNHMADVNDYRDPNTGQTYKVSNQYTHTYLDSTGRTILQTNSAYAPGPDTIWRELQPR